MSEMSTQEVLDRFDITYRKLDHWTTSKYLGDDTKQTGNGSSRRYTLDEIAVLGRMILLVNAGVLPNIASKVARGDLKAQDKLIEALEHSID